MRRDCRSSLRWIHVILWISALAAAALAEEPKPRTIEEVVVTAQKTEQNIQDVPISVTAIDGEFLKQAALTDLVDIVQYAPNVQFYESSSLFASFNVRGFATPPLGLGLEPSVGLVIDDVPYGRSTYSQDAVFDLERLEVLRGPQGALFGKNTVAGVLNFTTAEPAFEPSGYATVARGSLDERRAEGGVSFPLVKDVLATRLSFRGHVEDMGVFNTTRDEKNDIDDIAGRIKLLWLPRSDLDVKLNAWASHLNAVGTTAQLQQATGRSLRVFREFDPRTETDEFDGRTQIDSKTLSGRTAYAVSSKGVWSAGDLGFAKDLKLTGIGAWSRISTPYAVDPDFSPIPLGRLSSDGPNRYEQESLELRLSGSTPPPLSWGGGIDFVGGLYGDKTHSTIRQLFDVNLNGALAYLAAGSESEPSDAQNLVPVPPGVLEALDALTGSNPLPDILTGPPGALVTLDLIPPALATESLLSQTEHDAMSIAGFFQGTWHLTERWDLTLGARLAFDQQEADIFSTGEGLGVGAALADQEDFAAHLDLDETDFSPKVALSHHWSDDITFFATAARGFKAGGFDNAPLNDDHLKYDAEKGTSAEIGVKSRLLGGAMVLNATAYFAWLEDLQVRNFTGVTFTTANADRASSRGFELDFQWLPPLDGLTVGGSLGFIDAKFDRFPDGTPFAGSDADTQDLSGRPLPYTPKVSASLHPMLALPLLPSWGIGALCGVDFLYRSSRFLDSDLDPNTLQDATAKVNARFALVDQGGRWALTFAGKNLSGAKERLLIIDQPLLNGNYVAFPLVDEPTFTVNFRWNFG
jgi:iron complex outermembrane recepter protein